MQKRIIFMSTIIILLILLMLFVLPKSDKSEINKESKINENNVARVIDGDTFVLQSGEVVRLLCINAPERGEKGYEEAKTFLENLILEKSVTLEKDVSDKDIYNRSLRYVFQDNIFINKELVKSKNAKLFRYGNDTKRCDEIASF